MSDEPWEQQTANRVYQAVVSGQHRQQLTTAAHRRARRYATGGALAIVALAGIGLRYTRAQPADPPAPGEPPAVTQPTQPPPSTPLCTDNAGAEAAGPAGSCGDVPPDETTRPSASSLHTNPTTTDGCADNAAGADGQPISPNRASDCA